MFVHTTDSVNISFIFIYLSVQYSHQCQLCVFALFVVAWADRLVSAEIGNQRNAGTRLHMHLLWMKTFTLNAVAFPNSPTCLSISASYQPWLGIPSWHRLTQKPFHGRTTRVSIREVSSKECGETWQVTQKGMSHLYRISIHAFCTEQLLCTKLFLLQRVKFWRAQVKRSHQYNGNLIFVNAAGNFIQWTENKIFSGNKRHVSEWLW